MARQWIEFIQSQNLPWEVGDLNGTRPDLEMKVLSVDADSGACSLLLRYPVGWSRTELEFLAVDEEFLVLDGVMTLNGHIYEKFSYAHLPKGYRRESMSTNSGAVVLTFMSATPEYKSDETFDPARLVEHIDTIQVPYTGNFHPEFPPGAGRKTLFEDPVTGDQTWILGTMPLRWAERQEIHPVVEEMYLLSGEVHGNRGVMRPGAYFWRPPGERHGPYGSFTGNLYFFRTKGGKLSTEYVDSDYRFHWWPEFDPVIPEQMLPYSWELETAAGNF